MAFYITTPIFYVNAEPHLGHAYSTIAADVFARHMRQRGEDVFFLTGTDEHGEPVELAARNEGITPKELADRNAPRFEAMARAVNASNDFFIRTSDTRHTDRVAEVIQRVYDLGPRLRGDVRRLVLPALRRFQDRARARARQHVPDPRDPARARDGAELVLSPLGRSRTVWSSSMSASRSSWCPDFRRNEALSFIKGGLQDVSLSRAKLEWGMPLPWDPRSACTCGSTRFSTTTRRSAFAREGEDLTERFWPAAFHLLAKDILKFHAVIWPALLMAAEIEPPTGMVIHGYLLMGEKKMSKSLGNVLDPFEAIERYGSDALRFYCLREVSFGQDGSVSAAGFESRYETELANDFGNLASRTLAMIDRYRDGVVPEAEVDPELAGGEGGLEGLSAEVSELIDRSEPSQALEAIWVRVRRVNRYVEETRPWDLAKDDG